MRGPALLILPLLLAGCLRRPSAGETSPPATTAADRPSAVWIVDGKPYTPPRSGEPLWIIDGKPYVPKPDSALAPDLANLRIESIEMLKGAAATARFGDAGRDGVLLIRTKREQE